MRKFWILPVSLLFVGLGFFMWSNANQTKAKEGPKTPTNKAKQVQEKGINFFQGSWKAVKKKAAETGKPVFVDAYAEWCGPCKMMDRRVFTRKKVGEFYNKHFINYQYDMEKGNGPKFRKKFRVSAYPTLIYFSSDGEVVKRKRGAMGPRSLLKLGKRALKKIEHKQSQ
jgi:thiol:disulfide interchange protein